jgi:hypothetical protein
MDRYIPTYYVKPLPGMEYFKGDGPGFLYTYPGCTTEVIELPGSSEASTAVGMSDGSHMTRNTLVVVTAYWCLLDSIWNHVRDHHNAGDPAVSV